MIRIAAAAALTALVSFNAHAQIVSSAAADIADPHLDKKSAKANRPSSLGELWGQLESAEKAMSDGDLATASRLLDDVLSAPAFAELDFERSHFALASAAEVANKDGDFVRAHALYQRSSEHALATNDDWMGRLNSSWFIGNLDDAVGSLSKIARRWPEELQYISEWAINALLAHARSEFPEAELPLLQALFDSGWQTDLGREPSQIWMRMIELLIEEQAFDRALEVSSRLRDPLAIVTLRSDLRFAELVDTAPEWFNIEETIDAEIIEARLSVEAYPELLAPAIALAESLLRAGRADDALLVIDTHMTRAALKTVTGEAFEDVLSETVHALTTKALALAALERWDDAAAQLALAAKQTVSKERSDDLYAVALLQARLGLSDSALATLKRVTRRKPDPEADLVRFIVAQTRGDADAADAALDALVAAAGEASAQAQRALLIAGRTDAAARLLIRRLSDPAQRTPALLELQGMREQPWPGATPDWNVLTEALMSREDVRRSVDANGGIVSEYAIYRWN